MAELGSQENPLRVAIVGSGPSGMYAADALFKSPLTIQVDVFDRLPTPFGLLRGGVAPDHQKMKTIGKYYERVAAHERFSFFGNVKIGKDLSVEDLHRFYDAIIFACGAETDKRLGILGEELKGSHTATEFVGWYNGHPDYQDREFDLSQESVAVIGQGNVAIDVTRILAKTMNELKGSDITERALEKLAQSKVKEIHLIGRRGPVQAAFTELELKELGELENCNVVIDPKDLELSETCRLELEDEKNNKSRKNYALLQEMVKHTPKENAEKKIFLHFLKSPVAIDGVSHVEALELEINRLEGEPNHQRAVGTGKKEKLPCGLIFRSIGYRGIPIPGVPFDEQKGIFPNQKGRVLKEGLPIRGVYATGWIKRGPSGVLGTNKPDSTDTVNSLIEDLPDLSPCADRDTQHLITLLKERNVRWITFEEWKKLDEEEVRRGQALGKPREKFVSVEDMINFLKGVHHGAH